VVSSEIPCSVEVSKAEEEKRQALKETLSVGFGKTGYNLPYRQVPPDGEPGLQLLTIVLVCALPSTMIWESHCPLVPIVEDCMSR